MVGRVVVKKFGEINLDDTFFDTLKRDYQEFSDWFQRKADKEAYLIYNDNHRLDALLHLKTEPEDEIDPAITPGLPKKFRLKLATLKVAEGGQGNKYGEGLLKIAFDVALQKQVHYIYVTVFSKHESLINLLCQMGYQRYGSKTTPNGEEEVYIYTVAEHFNEEQPIKSYPFIPRNQVKAVRIVPIEAAYHSLLFPGSELKGAIHEIDSYIPASNAIRKIYLAGYNAKLTVPGDLLFFYRKKHPDEPGSSTFKSAVTTLGIVERVYHEGRDYQGLEEFVQIAGKRTAFTKAELNEQYIERRRIIIQFLYILSFGKGNNINHRTLIDNGVIPSQGYWGFLPISNESYHFILREAGVDDGYFID